VQTFVKQCYIRIWLSICIDRKISPPHAASRSAQSYQAVIAAFLSAAELYKLHNRAQLSEWHAPSVATEAMTMWIDAMKVRPPQEPMLMPEAPAYARALAGGAE